MIENSSRICNAGEVVEIREEDVFDSIPKYPDGRREGNTTGEIIQKMEKDPQSPRQHAKLTSLPNELPVAIAIPNN
jgi:hypothetical protein